MALAALNTAHHGFSYLTAIPQQFVHFFHFLIIRVTLNVDLRAFVALDTPFHGERRVLVNLFHRFNRAMAGLAFQALNLHVL